jgi:hypothetical protein
VVERESQTGVGRAVVPLEALGREFGVGFEHAPVGIRHPVVHRAGDSGGEPGVRQLALDRLAE